MWQDIRVTGKESRHGEAGQDFERGDISRREATDIEEDSGEGVEGRGERGGTWGYEEERRRRA